MAGSDTDTIVTKVRFFPSLPCVYGGTGRPNSLRNCRPNGHVSSTLTRRTTGCTKCIASTWDPLGSLTLRSSSRQDTSLRRKRHRCNSCMQYMLKAEKREKVVRNRDKMGSSARSFFQLIHIRNERLKKRYGIL